MFKYFRENAVTGELGRNIIYCICSSWWLVWHPIYPVELRGLKDFVRYYHKNPDAIKEAIRCFKWSKTNLLVATCKREVNYYD